MAHLSVNEQAHDFLFETPWQASQNFFAATEGKRVILLFLRYYGCTTCQLEIHQLIHDYPRFKAAGVELYIVLQSSAETIISQVGRGDIPFEIILDPRQKLYRTYNIGSRDPDAARSEQHQAKVKKARDLGFIHGAYEGNELQLPATFIIGPDHRIEYAYYGQEGSDIPAHDVLLEKLAQLRTR
ncbi:peroxiredoxin-like family protein [Acerihabitans sp. KWT182]|uniref:Peroxiredoxin-like family protein n=1 Tax=Acerihabitans sp. KWT182 TaxID=3157919 RepID=A0AAU7Q785_9GAMM